MRRITQEEAHKIRTFDNPDDVICCDECGANVRLFIEIGRRAFDEIHLCSDCLRAAVALVTPPPAKGTPVIPAFDEHDECAPWFDEGE